MTDAAYSYPTPLTRYLVSAEAGGGGGDMASCHRYVLGLAEAIGCYLGAAAVAQYTQAVVVGETEPDPTLNRSLRSLRRILPGQWLTWTARAFAAVAYGPLDNLAAWYIEEQSGILAEAYNALHKVMAERLAYTGEYKARDGAAPRHLLEMVDQYRIRRGKLNPQTEPADIDGLVAPALLRGLRETLGSTAFFTEVALYAPEQRHLLVGVAPTVYPPPVPAPAGTGATLLLLAPENTGRAPLFPLDPLLSYLYCPQCEAFRVAALREVINGAPVYSGLDPDCEHILQPVET